MWRTSLWYQQWPVLLFITLLEFYKCIWGQMLLILKKILNRRLENPFNNVFFVCLGFCVPFENFSLIWRRYHFQWRALNFDLFSALMAIEQWRFCECATPNVTQGIRLKWSSPRTRYTLTLPTVWQWSCHYLILRLKVVWDTLQYFQGWQDSKKWLQPVLKISKSMTFAPKMHL